jgi:hypothetical protein
LLALCLLGAEDPRERNRSGAPGDGANGRTHRMRRTVARAESSTPVVNVMSRTMP